MRELQAENQRLRDENNRLKGEQGKPDFKPNKKFKNISSEKERGGKTAKKNVAKSAEIVLERREAVTFERKTLPADARFKGYADSFSRDGNLLASGGDDGEVRLWDIKDRTVLASFEHKAKVLAVALTPDSARLISAGEGGLICAWDIKDQTLQTSFQA